MPITLSSTYSSDPASGKGGPDKYINAQDMQILMHGKMIMKFELVKTFQGLLTEARIFLSDGSMIAVSTGNDDQCNVMFWNKGADPAPYDALWKGQGD